MGSLRVKQWGESNGDYPFWWSVRFAALMLQAYFQVIHTNRSSRGLAVRSSDNVLPGYIDAMGPLLAQSPKLVAALVTWFSSLLRLRDLNWPTVRLLFVASRKDSSREELPLHALGRLPAELVESRILTFLVPADPPSSCGLGGSLSSFWSSWGGEDKRKDVIGVLAHLMSFAPSAAWQHLSSFGFSVVEAAIGVATPGVRPSCYDDDRAYLAATVLVTLAQRFASMKPECYVASDVATLSQLAAQLHEAAEERQTLCNAQLPAFVYTRIEVALEHARRVQDLYDKIHSS